jgi:hypothetical protein
MMELDKKVGMPNVLPNISGQKTYERLGVWVANDS